MEPPKPVITPLEKMYLTINYEDLEETGADIPIFRFLPARREVTQKLIIRAANSKGEKEFANIFK